MEMEDTKGRRGRYVKTEADWSDAVKSQGMPEPPEAVRSKEAFSPRDFGSVAMPTS